MPAKPISFGEIHFVKKGDGYDFLQSILHKYDVGDRVGVDDTKILLAALAYHPEAAAKRGSGIVNMSVRSADFGTKCFWLNRTDGTTVKFSLRACVYG